MHQGAFAAARGPHDGVEAWGVDAKVDPPQGRDVLARKVIGLGDLLHLKQRVCIHSEGNFAS